MASEQGQVIKPVKVQAPTTVSTLSPTITSFLVASRLDLEPIHAEPGPEPESSSNDDSSLEFSSPVKSLLTEQLEAYRKEQADQEEDSLTSSPVNPYSMWRRSPSSDIIPPSGYFQYR